MLNVPEEIKELFRNDNLRDATKKKLKLRFYDKVEVLYPSDSLHPSDALFPSDLEPWLVIENNRISSESLELTESLCDEDDIVFGACTASQCKLTVADVPEDVTGKEFLLSIEAGGYEMTMGIYRVESFERQADRRLKTITAYDRMRLFQVDVASWYNGLVFPMTLKSFRDKLFQYIGVDQLEQKLILDEMMVEKTIDPAKLYGLDVIQAVCEINGVFGQFEHTGYLKYMSLAITSLWPSETLYPADDLYPAEALGYEHAPHYKSLTYEDYLVNAIDKLQIRQEEGDVGVSVGNGTNGYTVEGNFLVYGKSATDMLVIATALYDAIGGRVYRPCILECPAMPWIEVGDGFIVKTSTDLIESFVLKRTLRGIQAMMDTLEAAGNETREENFGFSTQIIQLQGKTAAIKKSVEEVSVNLKDLKENTEAQFKIQADQIMLKVSKGEVSSQLSIEPDKITLAGNRLIVESTNFKLDGDGNAVFSGLVSGASIKGGTIDIGNGTFLVERDGSVSIDSGEINIGPVSINDTLVDLGAYKVSDEKFGSLFSYDESIWIMTKDFDETGPSVEIRKGNYKTRIGYGGITTSDIYLDALEAQYGARWGFISDNIIELWNRVENIENQL